MRYLLALAALLTSTAVSAQSVGDLGPAVTAADVVTWRVAAEHGARGGEASVVLRAEIADGWNLYAVGSPVGRPLEVELLQAPDGVSAAALRQSTPREGTDPALGVPYLYFAVEARVELPLRIGRAVARGRHRVRGAVRYAVCDDSVCLAPTESRFRVPLVVR